MKTFLKKFINKFGYELKKKRGENKASPELILFYKFEELSKLSSEDFFRFNQKVRGLFNKYRTFTMVPYRFFYENLLLTEIFKQKTKGAIVECGCWRGGMIASMAEIIGNSKPYYIFDSFEGLPDAKEIDGSSAIEWQNNKSGAYYFDNCKAELEFAESAMKLSGTDNYKLIKGWFSDTLPDFKIAEGISILRLDSDWYDSTMTCLTYLYPMVNKGGLIIIDDYYTWDGCSKAIHDYLSANKLSDRIFCTPQNVAYIIKN